MNLGQYIQLLEKLDPNTAVPLGLGNPHSWRGSYNELSFEPICNTTIEEMLVIAKGCIGRTFGGWKGGEFTMHECTPVHVDLRGCCENLGLTLLILLLAGKSPIDLQDFDSAWIPKDLESSFCWD